MKNRVKFVFAAALFAFIFGSFSEVQAQSQPLINALYKKMDANFKTLTSLKTGIRMEKYNSQLKDVEDRREGTALIVPIKNSRNANFRLDWTKGAQETLSVVNGKYKLYQPRLQQVIEGKSSEYKGGGNGAQGAFSLLNMSAKDLKANYSAEWREPETVANIYSAYKLHLTPKTAAQFESADVWVTEDGMVVQFKVNEKNGDWTNILLFDFQKNTNIKNQIALNPPPGTKVVKG